VTGTRDCVTTRRMRNTWFMPFAGRLTSGTRQERDINSATPVGDVISIKLAQVLFHNDREEDGSTQELIEWDTAIIAEDRDILESTDPDAVVEVERKIECRRTGLVSSCASGG
jgi:hypothetical protein